MKHSLSCLIYYYYEIRGVRKSDETLSRVFEISSQLEQKLMSKWQVAKSMTFALI